jgi:calcineurin-like phosphoesterase family protein
MPSVFLCSDHHFGHEKTCTVFKKADGSPLRPFANAEEMNEEMIKRHNEKVRPNDKCYFLGDVVINRKFLNVVGRLNGDKVLIRGNHDIFKLEDYTQCFRDIRSYHVMNGLILSHVPIHTQQLARFGCNIHGHLHDNRVMKARGVNAVTGEVMYGNDIDPRYFNVSVEQIDFTPILFEDACKKIVEQGGTVGFKNGNGPVM